MSEFRTPLAQTIFENKYQLHEGETWRERAEKIVDWVCGTMGDTTEALLPQDERDELVEAIATMKFMPGGRYIYYAGRDANFWNNCFLLKAEEDTREEWAELANRVTSCLMTGGGIGVDYSVIRPRGATLKRTGGEASGPIPLMNIVNEIGRNVMQGGSRRSAIYASLNWQHGDAEEFLHAKDWKNQMIPGTEISIHDAKNADFNFPAPLDMTNISLNYDDAFITACTNDQGEFDATGIPEIFFQNVRQAMSSGEPGFSFNFGDKENETLRNACCEVTSEDDSDVCNLGSVNLGRIESINEFMEISQLATRFLMCGTLRADLPFHKVYEVRKKNRRLGLGLMGMHEWLLKRGERYEVTPELHQWLKVWKATSDLTAWFTAEEFGVSQPVAVRAIAPTGTIGLLAGTTTGIEPLFAVAYKRRYLTNGTEWKEQYVIDGTAKEMIDLYGLDPYSIDSAVDLANDPVRRMKFQADVQDYVDQAISSTINLPEWGSLLNNESKVHQFAVDLARLAPRLRGFTVYPDGARGGQPLTPCDYYLAHENEGVEFDSVDVCELTGGGSCGL